MQNTYKPLQNFDIAVLLETADLLAIVITSYSIHYTKLYDDAWRELQADAGCDYDEHAEIDLTKIEPLIACPSSPGNIKTVREVAGTKADQVIIGSSVNSSFRDLMVTARIIEGRHAHPGTSLHINPGSRQVLENVAQEGGIMPLLLRNNFV